METKFLLLSVAVVWTLLVAGCANLPAKISSESTRPTHYATTVKRMVVVIGPLGVFDRRAVRSHFENQLKSNQVNALVLEHNPLVLSSDPILANQDAVRALRPDAILHLRILQMKESLRENVHSTFRASMTISGGRTIWDSRLTVHGMEQAEAGLVAELMKKLIADRIIDKNAIDLDAPAGSSRT